MHAFKLLSKAHVSQDLAGGGLAEAQMSKRACEGRAAERERPSYKSKAIKGYLRWA